MRLDEWIKNNLDRWYAACGVRGKEMTVQEAKALMNEITSIKPFNPEFLGLIFLIMTRYFNDSPQP